MATTNCYEDLMVISANMSLFIFNKPNKQQLADQLDAVSLVRKIDVSQFCLTANTKKDHKHKNEENVAGDSDAEAKAEAKSLNNQIINACFSHSGNIYALVTAFKQLVVFDVNKDWQIRGEVKVFPKAPTIVHFDKTDANILISDRAGYIRRYQVDQLSEAKESEELLGHLSMLLDFCLSPDGRFILTADRDEKLRISRYPQTFVIEQFCLGHTSFVSSVACFSNLAITSGGDGTVRFWDMNSGECAFATQTIFNSPVKKICVFPTDLAQPNLCRMAVLTEDSNCVHFLSCQVDSWSLKQSDVTVDVEDALLDITIDSGSNVVCPGKNGIYLAKTEDSEFKIIVLSETKTILEELKQCTEAAPLCSLYKKVEFGNLHQYKAIKEEKMLRKRKLVD
uniref:tRNA (guanine-N(7)-)-methyltransferase non-catalytic subunit n=1 Tax=Ditylenchus dipsaci TaxID=166011 RepID=A0A915EBD1_9BILA